MNIKSIQYAPADDKSIFYPESDGRPLAETDLHRVLIIETYQKLNAYYKEYDDVYVSGNLLIYDIPGKTNRSISPDVMVVYGIEKKMRRTYKTWEEGKAPDFVMEFSSKSTFRQDLTKKKTRYAHIGVREYFLYDPERSYLAESLMGLRLNDDGEYDPIPSLSNKTLYAETLGLEFSLQDDRIGIYNPVTKEWLQTPEEKANAKAEQEAFARQHAEREVERLRAEIDRLQEIRAKYEN